MKLVPCFNIKQFITLVENKLNCFLEPEEVALIFFPQEQMPRGCAKKIYFDKAGIQEEKVELNYLLEEDRDPEGIQALSIKIKIMEMFQDIFPLEDFVLVEFPY